MIIPYNSATVQAYKNQINSFSLKIDNGTITQEERQQAKTAVGNYYTYLAATGIKYGQTGYDVSQDVGDFANFANEHLRLNAIAQGKNEATIDYLISDFMIKLALNDADARLGNVSGIAADTNGFISYAAIAKLHYDVLENDFSLDKTAWGGTLFEEFSGSGYVSGDRVSYQNALAAIDADLLAGQVLTGLELAEDGALKNQDILVGVENIIGTDFDDNILGDEKDNILIGDAGNDVIDGDRGDDFIFGGDGNDDLSGGDGNDRLDGGNGKIVVKNLVSNKIFLIYFQQNFSSISSSNLSKNI